jgi:hypothetical protein
MLPSGPSPHLSSQEVDWHRFIQDSVVPMLSEGVVCAMRDQPNDPAAYLAEFLAAKGGSAEVAHTLSSRKLAGECARLDVELRALHEQLQTARAEAQRRLPNATLLEAVEQKESDAAASWSEMRRLKKLVRSMKLKAGVPLDASQWMLPEGVVLVQASPGVDAELLCSTLARDFGAAYHRWQLAEEPHSEKTDQLRATQLAGVRGELAAPDATLLLYGLLDGLDGAQGAAAVQRLSSETRHKPAALLLLVEGEPEMVRSDGDDPSGGGNAAAEAVRLWRAGTAAAIEEACEEAAVTVLRVSCDGDFDDQMSSLLVAVSSD